MYPTSHFVGGWMVSINKNRGNVKRAPNNTILLNISNLKADRKGTCLPVNIYARVHIGFCLPFGKEMYWFFENGVNICPNVKVEDCLTVCLFLQFESSNLKLQFEGQLKSCSWYCSDSYETNLQRVSEEIGRVCCYQPLLSL